MISYPSTKRRTISGSIVVISFLYVVLVKFNRQAVEHFTSDLVAGVLPNLVCAFAIPLMIFFSDRQISRRDFLIFDAFVAIGLFIYEFLQLVMPNRTFDWNDLLATAVGAMFAVPVGFVIIAFSAKPPNPAPQDVS